MNAIGGMAVGERSEGLGQPVVGVNRAQLAVFDERGDDRPVVAAFVGAGEERVLSVQREVAWRIWNQSPYPWLRTMVLTEARWKRGLRKHVSLSIRLQPFRKFGRAL